MPKSSPREPPKKVSVNLPKPLYEGIIKLKEQRGYSRMADAIRWAVREGLIALKILKRRGGEAAGAFLPYLAPVAYALIGELNRLAGQIFWLQIFLWLLAGLGVFALAYLGYYLCRFGFGGLIIRAEAPEERARAQRVLAGCLIGGACLILARPIAGWLTNIYVEKVDTDGDKKPDTYYFYKDENGNGKYDKGEELDLPSELADMVDKLLTFVMVLGAVVLIVGIMWGGIQLGRKLSARAK